MLSRDADLREDRMQEPRKILLFCLPGVGDTLMFTPALSLLRKRFPGASVTALTMFRGSQDVLDDNPNLDRVLFWDFLGQSKINSVRFVLGLRKERFDVSITAFPAFRKEYNLVSLLAGARKRIAHRFPRGYFRQLTFLNTHTVPVDEGAHNVVNSLNLLKEVGIDWKAEGPVPGLQISLSGDDESHAGGFLEQGGLGKDRPVIGIHPGTVHYRQAWLRRWPAEKFAELADMLHESYGADILVFEGPSEKGVGERIAGLASSPVTVVSGMSLRQVAAIIRRCDVLVSNDSGLMHVAAAVRTPALVILGPTNPAWIFPWESPHGIVRRELPCSPCYTYMLAGLSCRTGGLGCIRSILASEVFDAASGFLGGRVPAGRSDPGPARSHDAGGAPEVLVIVLNWNNYHYTKPCLESLLRSTYPNMRVCVVDNGSRRDSVEQMKRDFGTRVTIIENGCNLGFAEGNNVGLRQARGKYSVMLNNDTQVEPGWLEPMVAVMERDETVSACQPKIRALEDRKSFEYAGAAGGFMDVYGYPFTRGRVFMTIEEDRGQYDDMVEVVWCSGTALLIRNSVLEETGLIDPFFFIYAEEADLCWRMAHCGYRLMCVPSSVVYHAGMGTMRSAPFTKVFYPHRNGIIRLVKNDSWQEQAQYLPVRGLLDCVSIVYYAATHPLQWNHIAVIKAYIMLLFSIPAVLKSRRSVVKLKQQFAHRRKKP